eukprot:3866896-Prymnesium_polylepis.2
MAALHTPCAPRPRPVTGVSLSSALGTMMMLVLYHPVSASDERIQALCKKVAPRASTIGVDMLIPMVRPHPTRFSPRPEKESRGKRPSLAPRVKL